MARTRIVIGGMTWDYWFTTKSGPGGAANSDPGPNPRGKSEAPVNHAPFVACRQQAAF